VVARLVLTRLARSHELLEVTCGIVAAMWKPSEAVQQRHSDVEAQPMGIGVSIFLLAVGAILTFAVEAEVAGIDLDVVGLILMAVGALGLVMTLLVWGPRRRVARVERSVVPQREVVEERRVYDDPAL
jgi:Domain of unknown function (DUF6458)